MIEGAADRQGEFRKLPSNFTDINRNILYFDQFYSAQTFRGPIRENNLSQGSQRILGEPNAGGSSWISEAFSFERLHFQYKACLEKVRTNNVHLGHIEISPTVKLSLMEVPKENYNKIK